MRRTNRLLLACIVCLVCLLLPLLAATAKQDAYAKRWGGWEDRMAKRVNREAEPVFAADFSAAGLARDWKADAVDVKASDQGVALSVAKDHKGNWGALWLKQPITGPLAVEVEFSLHEDCPHDANLFWGQKAPTNQKLGQDQECFVGCYFGWGGRGCGIERASDWHVLGVTGTITPRAGQRYKGLWVIDGREHALYLDGQLAIYGKDLKDPPETGHFGLEVYLSAVTYHSVKIWKLKAK